MTGSEEQNSSQLAALTEPLKHLNGKTQYVKNSTLRGYRYLTLSFEENPLTQQHEILSQKNSLWDSPYWPQ